MKGVNEFNRVITSAQKQLLYNPSQYSDLAPLDPDQVKLCLHFLFPDASDDSKFKYGAEFFSEMKSSKFSKYLVNFKSDFF